MKKLIFLLLITALYFAGCSNDSLTNPNSDLIVVRGYIYAGEPVDDIQITSTLPLGSEETKAPPINDADVSLIKDGVRYDLVPSLGDSGYYHYEWDDLTVNEGDEFEIAVSYQNQHASGKTTVPNPPRNVTLSSETLLVPDFSSFGPGGFNDSSYTIFVNWEYDPSSLFYVVIECIEENPDSIDTFMSFGGKARASRKFISAPTNMNEYRIQWRSVSFYGKHRIKVYRVNQEYADLYSSRQQDSRDLNEPLTNIENGLGVFSAFNSVETVFNVVQETD